MELHNEHVQARNIHIILSWTTDLDPKKIENIKIEEGMITYTYEGNMCMCENKPFHICKKKALDAKMHEIQLAIDETLNA